MKMDPFIEVVFEDKDADHVLKDRFELPIFFIVGGVDDAYLGELMRMGEDELRQSFDVQDGELIGIYASRSTLFESTYPQVFDLDNFLQPNWPILLDLENPDSYGVKKPNWIETTWIIRALRRNGLDEMADQIRRQMNREIYPTHVHDFPTAYTVNTIAELASKLTPEQKNYPIIIIIDDLPIKLNTTLGKMLSDIALTRCTSMDLSALQTSLELLALK